MDETMEIILGHGTVEISGCDSNGREGIRFLRNHLPHTVDEIFEEPSNNEDVIIWLDNIEGARVLQDQVNAACLRMNRYTVENVMP